MRSPRPPPISLPRSEIRTLTPSPLSPADSSGNTYATGYRRVIVSSAGNTANDVFVTKIDASGNVTLLATLSGKGSDQGNGIAVDPAGNIYVAGLTTSPDFLLLNPLQSVSGQGPGSGSGFLTKLSPDGSIVYSTYPGGIAHTSWSEQKIEKE